MNKYLIRDLYDSSVLTACIQDKNIVGLFMEILRFCSYPESYLLEEDGKLNEFNTEALDDMAVFLKEGLDYNPKKIDMAKKIYEMSLNYLEEIDLWEKLEEAHLCFWYVLVEDWDLQTIKIPQNPFNLFFLNFVFSYNFAHVEKSLNSFIDYKVVQNRWKAYIKESMDT